MLMTFSPLFSSACAILPDAVIFALPFSMMRHADIDAARVTCLLRRADAAPRWMTLRYYAAAMRCRRCDYAHYAAMPRHDTMIMRLRATLRRR